MAKTLEQKIHELKTKNQRDKKLAGACELPVNQYLLLKALEDGELHTYRELVMKTGIYSNLPAELRDRHEGSLGHKGLVEEDRFDIDGKDIYTFKITAKGKKTLAKATAPKKDKELVTA